MPTAARLVKRRAGFVIGSGGTLHYDCPRSVRITYASTFNRLTTIFRGRPPVHSPPPTRRPSHPASARSRRLVFSSSSSSSSSTEPWKPGGTAVGAHAAAHLPGETRKLLQRLEAVGRGEAFLLQGGDCAETFADFSPQKVHSTFCTLIGQAIALALASGLPIVKIGRIAGQFAKPRSLPHDASGLPSYRGDIVHSAEPNAQARVPDPERLIKAYSQSAAAMNLIRALAKSTSSMMDWLQQMEMLLRRHGALDTPFGARMHQFMEEVEDSLRFVHACGIDENSGSFTEPEFYTSHEALLLNYEEALTHRFVRNMPIWEEEEEEVQLAAASHGSAADASGTYFATSAHFMWIGERTRQLDAAHVEFLRVADAAGRGEPAECARSGHPDYPHGRRWYRARATTVDAGGTAVRPTSGVVVRPDARQYGVGDHGVGTHLQDALRGWGAAGGAHLLRRRSRGRVHRRRPALRDDRRGGDRMCGRTGGRRRERPRPALPVRVRPATESGASAGGGVCGGRAVAGSRAGATASRRAQHLRRRGVGGKQCTDMGPFT
eukprot:ctg_93.g18